MTEEADFGALMRDRLALVQERNAAALAEVADVLMERVVEGAGVALAAGAGHSFNAVTEAFYRAGGLATVKPLHAPELLPVNGASSSTAAERKRGLAAEVLARAKPEAGDVLFIFSTSGVNFYPVEMAREAADRRIPVVAVTSRECNAAAPPRAGSTLSEEADHVLDTCVRPGDVSYPPESPETGAVSSLANAFLWNLLLAELHSRAAAAGIGLPLWRSSNMPGGDEANAGLLERYRSRVPELG
ncbi:sugar isomerase domain-containing protein [Streptomonospora wellingtoniae]|uniref:Sugar isomerase domain-containing protein n=1 Tax=Streptomonospora wellingtoniae TaxID=3075544 RepID=A0ABU2KRU5_9ACTN|nr:sugar isomerase domain-containing protein [Streptomonospora sp. DSM 45055]MDT0302012.1 sugar isomerase domain-containing protein [Streptomonospora sp. DSM 45055]